MNQEQSFLKVIPQSTLRRWRSTPTYFFLIWRWGTLLFALIWYLTLPALSEPGVLLSPSFCLAVAFLQSTIVTLYAPLSRLLSTSGHSGSSRRARRQRQLLRDDEKTGIFNPLANTRNAYWNASIYVLDVLICGLLTYFSAVNSNPSFGDGSPFYRYGLSAVLVVGFTYSYSGGLLAALAYSLFAIAGAFVPPPGQVLLLDKTQLLFNIAGAVIDAPLIALLAAYLASQLNRAIASKRSEQEHARRETALRGVSEMLVTEQSDAVLLLRRSLRAIRQGGHFEKLVIALVRRDTSGEAHPDFDTYVETDVAAKNRPDVSEELVSLVAKTGQRHLSFDALSETLNGSHYGIARLYKPFFKDRQVYLVIGAERMRATPFHSWHEEFLATIN